MRGRHIKLHRRRGAAEGLRLIQPDGARPERQQRVVVAGDDVGDGEISIRIRLHPELEIFAEKLKIGGGRIQR